MGDEHASVVSLGMRQPGASAHPGVHLECALEMPLSVFPLQARRSEDREIARYRPDIAPAGSARVQPRIGLEQPIESRRTVTIFQARCGLGQDGEAEEPLAISRKLGEV